MRQNQTQVSVIGQFALMSHESAVIIWEFQRTMFSCVSVYTTRVHIFPLYCHSTRHKYLKVNNEKWLVKVVVMVTWYKHQQWCEDVNLLDKQLTPWMYTELYELIWHQWCRAINMDVTERAERSHDFSLTDTPLLIGRKECTDLIAAHTQNAFQCVQTEQGV